MGPLTLFPKLIRLFWFNRRHQALSTLTDLICLNYLKDSSYKWSDWLCQRALVSLQYSLISAFQYFYVLAYKHTFLYRLCDLALAGVIMVRWQLLFIELRSILIFVGSLSFFIHTAFFPDTFLGFQLVCLLVSFSLSLKLCLIGEEDEHHHLVIEYTFWIQTDHHSFYIFFFITSNNAKKYERLWSNIEAHSRKCFFPPSLSQTRDTVIKEKMLLPEASSSSLPLSLHPHPTLPCYGGDAFTTEFCF